MSELELQYENNGLECELAAAKAELNEIKNQPSSTCCYVHSEWLQSENKRLQAEIEVLRNLKTYEVATENKRLREALEKIPAIKNKSFGGDWDEIEEARKIAKSALDGKGGKRE